MPVLMMLSREVRRVPLDFEHPRNSRGDFQPVYDEFYVPKVRAWLAGWDHWQTSPDPRAEGETFEDWHGDGPDPDYYHLGADWPEGAELGICMYETVTEGTPISAVYADTADGRIAMAGELAGGEYGITTGLSVQDWLGVITGQLVAKDVHTGELS